MPQPFDLVITGGETFTPMGLFPADVGIRGGRIVAIGNLGGADAARRIDARGLTVLPGIIDTQVHFREPGPSTRKTWRPAPRRPPWAASPPSSRCRTPSR